MPENYFHLPPDPGDGRHGEGGIDCGSFSCVACGEPNPVFVEPTSTWMFEPGNVQRQVVMQECVACLHLNTVNLRVERDGDVILEVEPYEA